MQKLNQDHVSLKMYPGLIDWLGYQKDPDALVCKLLSDYRHRHPTTTLRKAANTFCAIVAGVMLGYGWHTYHAGLTPPQAPQVISYPDIAIDLTPPKHLTSWKYKTVRY